MSDRKLIELRVISLSEILQYNEIVILQFNI